MKNVITISLISLTACELLSIDVPLVSISCFIVQMSSIVEIIEKANNRALQPTCQYQSMLQSQLNTMALHWCLSFRKLVSNPVYIVESFDINDPQKVLVLQSGFTQGRNEVIEENTNAL